MIFLASSRMNSDFFPLPRRSLEIIGRPLLLAHSESPERVEELEITHRGLPPSKILHSSLLISLTATDNEAHSQSKHNLNLLILGSSFFFLP